VPIRTSIRQITWFFGRARRGCGSPWRAPRHRTELWSDRHLSRHTLGNHRLYLPFIRHDRHIPLYLNARRPSPSLGCSQTAASTMASTLKRRRGPVSYKEPSSDEGFTDLSDESEQEIRRRRKRLGPQRRSTRNQSSKAEQSSSGGRRDDDAAAPRTVRNKVLRGKRRISYQEDTTDDESMAGSDFEESAPTTPAKRQRSCAPASRGRKKKKSSSERPRSKALGAPRKPKRGTSIL
jgi:hypothetical protein